MRILVAAFCWAPAASVITLAVFVSYFKAGCSVAIPKSADEGAGGGSAGRGSRGMSRVGGAGGAVLQHSSTCAPGSWAGLWHQAQVCAEPGFSPHQGHQFSAQKGDICFCFHC